MDARGRARLGPERAADTDRPAWRARRRRSTPTGARTRSRAISCRRPHSDRRELMAEVDGTTLVARSLKPHGGKFIFGIGWLPAGPMPKAAQKEGSDCARMR